MSLLTLMSKIIAYGWCFYSWHLLLFGTNYPWMKLILKDCLHLDINLTKFSFIGLQLNTIFNHERYLTPVFQECPDLLFSENSQICRAFSIRNSFLIPPSWFSTHFLSHPHDFLLMLAIRNYCTDIQNMHLATYSALFKAAALFKAVWFPHWYSILLPI